MVEQSAFEEVDTAAWQCPYDSSLNADAEVVADSMRIVPCLEVTVLDAEHIFTRETLFLCQQTVT
jgi:hypothetical protein